MVGRHTRLRVKRKLRVHKKQVVGLGDHANKQLDRHIFRRWHNLKASWRFVAGWIGLILLLIVSVVFQTRALGGFYLAPSPISGGVYSEGIQGSFTNANPIYATSEVDSAVSRLLFSPLLSYDDNNQLTTSLAETWEADARATQFTVTLKPKLVWHDGQPITSDDVVYTFSTIQNPDAKSPLLTSWTGVTIEKINDRIVRFTLPGPYSPFPHSLTTGILPKHVLQKIPAEQLRSTLFNTKNPIGSGPFKWKSVTVSDSKDDRSDTIRLVRFNKYYDGAAKLDGITIRTYQTDEQLKKAVQSKEVITAAGLNLSDKEIDNNYKSIRYNLMSANMLFLNNARPYLADKQLRLALTKAANVSELNSSIGYPAIPVKEPLLKGQIGYDPAYYQSSYNKQEAINILESAGWKINPGEQVRKKNGEPLKLTLVYESNPDFARVVDSLRKMWADIGADLVVNVSQGKDESAQYLSSHDYDVLLYGINIGADPDVYPYWHSSQTDKKSKIHLNLSEYQSKAADKSLEAGRTRVDSVIRASKYKPFLEAWQADAPAIGLYQPQYLYISNQTIYGADAKTINNPSDRFNNVNNWMIDTHRAVIKS